MPRSWSIPVGLAFAIILPLMALGDAFDWSPQAVGWPTLAVSGVASVLHVVMWQAELDARDSEE